MCFFQRKKVWQILGMTFCLVWIILSQTYVVHALSLELFGTTTLSNNSQTTVEEPFLHVENTPVTFVLTGEDSVGIGAITTGEKYGILEIPTEMVGYVQVNGPATVQTTVTVPLSQSPLQVLMPTISSVISLIVNSPLVSAANKTAVNQALTELTSENFGSQNLSLAITPRTSTQFEVAISQGLLPILATTLKNRVQNLLTVVTAIPLIGTVLGVLLTPFTTALNQLINNLNSPTSADSRALVAGSILGNTQASFPFLISSPAITSDYVANFSGMFIQTDETLIQLEESVAQTAIYFSAGSLDMETALLPSDLDFGEHTIQTQIDELLIAKENQQVTTGVVQISDTRLVEKFWQLKVEQLTSWNQGTNELLAQLQIKNADLISTFPAGSVSSTANQTVGLNVGVQQTLVQLNGTTQPGNVLLNLSEFQLFVPKEAVKSTGTYQTVLEWVLSDTPS
ncbi:adhesive domain-containing protein [Enterococcus thailandicus]|uniref:adhesive domain-containing protein n=1 Tax=Enterococcus thailandicus TaxID=417368 RepID=UPI0022EBE60F|nr:adhesive domain-containing protein [Enterococcus thailandicus]MDA3964064.1 WxL domain-containing protein [Enterococcus thailandicus]